MNTGEAETLKEKRIKLFREATKMQVVPEQIPQISSCFTWKILDEGYKLSEAVYSYDILEKVVRAHQERYGFDAVRDVGTRNAFKMIEGWAEPRYIVDDEHGYISVKDQEFMLADEYGQLLDDRIKYFWSVVMPRRYPELKHSTPEQMQQVLKQFGEFMGFGGKMNKILEDEYGVPTLAKLGLSGSGHENFTSKLRGIAGTGVDQRRHHKEMMEVIEMFNKKDLYPALDMIKANPGEDLTTAFDVQGGCLSYTLLSIPQWEEMYWPTFKQGIQACVDAGKTLYLFIQGDFTRFIDYFAEFPKGYICIHVEQGDIFDIRKRLPNIALAGGMPITLLGESTPEKCVDYAKKLIGELGPKGFIMSQDKILSYRNDAKRENLEAVCSFTREYSAL